MPPAAGQPAAPQGTEPGQGHRRAAAEGRRAECVCEAESELESIKIGACLLYDFTCIVLPSAIQGALLTTRRSSKSIRDTDPNLV